MGIPDYMPCSISRRELIGQTLALAGGAGCLCALAQAASGEAPSCCVTPLLPVQALAIAEKTITVDLTKAPSLGAVGGSAMVGIKDRLRDIIIVRPEKRKYLALSLRCARGRAAVTYNHKKRFLQCTSFGHAIFRLDGSVEKGPAQSPLKSYALKLGNGKLDILL